MNYYKYVDGTKFKSKDNEFSTDIRAFDSCGIDLGTEYMVIDIDDVPKDTIESIIKYLDIQTMYIETDRGYHFVYSIPQNKVDKKGKPRFPSKEICFLGIPVEYKFKTTTLKKGKEARKVFNEDEIEELPKCWEPTKSLPSLLGWADGDNRYNTLIKYKSQLGPSNEHDVIFDCISNCVFSEKMKDEKLKLIKGMKKQQDSKPIDNIPGDTGTIMLKNKPVLFCDRLYLRIDGRYVDDVHLFNRMIYKDVNQMLSTAEVNEVLKRVEYQCEYIPNFRYFPVRFKNGILSKGKFHKIEYEEFTPYDIDREYNPDVQPVPELDKFLDYISDNDPTYRKFLLQHLSQIFETNVRRKAALPLITFLVGDGGNGKGMIGKLLTDMVGGENKASNKPTDFLDKDKLLASKGKLLNLGEDIENVVIDHKQMERLKNIAAADEITTRELYTKARGADVIAPKLVFTSNHVLKTYEKGRSVDRRITWIPMNKPMDIFENEFYDKVYSNESVNYLLKLILDEYLEMYDSMKLVECKTIKEFNEEAILDNNTAKLYVTTNLADINMVLDNKPKSLYQAYKEWCIDEDIDYLNQGTFKEEIAAFHKVVPKNIKKDGKTTRVYTPL